VARLAEIEPVPDPSLRLVERWLSTRGPLAGALLRGGTAAEVCLDYRSEQECARLVHVAVVLSPLVTALAAASPLASARPSGYRCFRARCWQATDPDRSGPLWRLVREGFTFDRWLDWLLALPVICVPRDGRMIEARDLTFARWMERGYEGTWPGLSDFDRHSRTALPEVRVGRRIELRGADNGPLAHPLGLAALWKGLLYDEEALQAAEAVAGAIPLEDLPELLDTAIEVGLSGRFGGRSLRAWVGYLLEIASGGLSRQAPDGPAEVAYLAPLVELARSGEAESARILRLWESTLDPRAFLAELAYPSITSIRPVAPSAGRWGTAELRALTPRSR
jgi:glutamate--cysteine ligase